MSNQYLETFKAEALGKSWQTKVNITGTEWSFQLDEPVEDGGKNSGANPMQFFIAALAACQNEQAQVVAEELSLSIEEITINVEVDLDLAGFMGIENHSNESYKNARLEFFVSGDLSEENVMELGKRVDARCPILGLLRNSGCKIDSVWSKK